MASPLDICNSALIKLGVEPITSLSEESKAAELCNRQYYIIRDRLLEGHYWNFCMKRATLALLPDAPEFGYSNAYSLPADCLRAMHLNVKEQRFKVENGKRLLTNLSNAKLLYIAKIEDVSRYSHQFREALADQLAVDLSYSLVQNSAFSERLAAKAARSLSNARSFDAQEGTMDELTSDTWINSRLGGIGDYAYDDTI